MRQVQPCRRSRQRRLADYHCGNDTGFITQTALEHWIDAVFFITVYHQGFEAVRRQMTDKEQKAWDKKISDSKYINQLAAHELEVLQMEARIKADLTM